MLIFQKKHLDHPQGVPNGWEMQVSVSKQHRLEGASKRFSDWGGRHQLKHHHPIASMYGLVYYLLIDPIKINQQKLHVRK